MNLKHFLYPLACLILVVAFAACNSDNEYTVDAEQSAEGRIISFSIDAKPYTAIDSLTYPAFKNTKFTIQNRGGYNIFNNDSLPVQSSIRSLALTLQYANSTHVRTDLVYPKDSTDYPTEWNETDSVKFLQIEQQDGSFKFYPQLKVVAANGHERIYDIQFKIHTQKPDSINWQQAKKSDGKEFTLNRKGETKVIATTDQSGFIAFIKDGSGVYKYTSLVDNLSWSSEVKTDLPTSAIVKSLHYTNELLVLITTDETVYTSPIGDGQKWTKHDKFKIRSIVGLLPEVAAQRSNPLNEFLVTVDQAGTLVYAKTSDFETIEDLKILTRNDSKVLEGFPLKEYNSLQRAINENENFIITIAGKDSKSNLVKRPWIIKNISLANTEANKLAEVSIVAGGNSYTLPYTSGITAFLYEDKIQAISGDSLSLYSSAIGDSWTRASNEQKLAEGMKDMNTPSVVVDKENYMWVFGGVSSKGSTYSDKIWRGRINRLGFERK